MRECSWAAMCQGWSLAVSRLVYPAFAYTYRTALSTAWAVSSALITAALNQPACSRTISRLYNEIGTSTPTCP
jgi:hypothetical protein